MYRALKTISLMLFFSLVNIIDAQTKFAVVGDYGDSTSTRAQAVANIINGWDVDFIVTIGDNYYGGNDANFTESMAWIDADIGKFYSDWIGNFQGAAYYGSGSLTNKFFPAMGNHDFYHIDSSDVYTDYFTLPGAGFTNTSGNERYYDFVWDNKLHFFMLSNYGVGVTEYEGLWGTTPPGGSDPPQHGNYGEPDGVTITSIQHTWFKAQMENCRDTHPTHWRVVILHHPPYTSGDHGPNLASQWPFKLYGAHIVLSGHDHHYERLVIDGLTYIVNGLGGRNRVPVGPGISGSVVRYSSNYGAMLFEIIGENQLRGQFIDRQGFQRDDFTLVDSALPVELSSFNGLLKGNSVELLWRTETEINNYGFEIERTKDKLMWQTIGFVEGNGNSNSPKQYNFSDTDIVQSGTYYYRLKQIDNDGSYEYSDVVSVEVDVPNKFYLSQNYPNPFNPETRIEFTLPEKEQVSLRVYNALGELVKELVNELKEAGSYSVIFNASNLTSGIYIYRLRTSSFSANKKMTLLK